MWCDCDKTARRGLHTPVATAHKPNEVQRPVRLRYRINTDILFHAPYADANPTKRKCL